MIGVSERFIEDVIFMITKDDIKCPLTLVCYPSCFWWKDGRCIFPRRDTPRTKDIEGNNGWLAALRRQEVSPGINEASKIQNKMSGEYIGNALLAATSCALLWFFGAIWVEGSHYIREPNIIILSIETAGMAVISGFAIYNLLRLIRRLKK